MKIEEIGKVCHEAVRAYCETLDGTPHTMWESASKEQRASIVRGVEYVRDNPGASQSAQHEAWLADKAAEGWRVGPVKDVDKKEHPCFIPYDQLPEDQKTKDALFQGVARALLPSLTGKIHEPKVAKFEAGNVVQLRSGGPDMTVVVVAGDDVTCSWFVQLNSTTKLWANDYESGTFPKDALALVRRL